MTSPKEIFTNMVEIWNAHDRAGWMTLCSPDVMVHGVPAGLPGWGAHYDLLQGAFPDNQLEVTVAVAEADLVCCEVRLTGTHTGMLPPWQATGKRVTLDFSLLARVADGKVISLTAHGIMEGLIHRLGMTPGLEAVTDPVGARGGA